MTHAVPVLLLLIILMSCTALCTDTPAPSASSPVSSTPGSPAITPVQLDATPVIHAKNTLLGFAISPARMPGPGEGDIDTFFNLAAQESSHVTLITEWKDRMPATTIKQLMSKAKERGLKFHLYLSPISLTGGRKTPDIPAGNGGTGFTDERVRAAFKDRALELAALRPDYLGLGTEVNLLAADPEEFDAYVSLVQETYRVIKEKYPDQVVTVSFQWDTMIITKEFGPLKRFSNSLDVYSFTTYPGVFKDPATIPTDYYSCIRKLLPTQRLGFSEVGWSSGNGGSEEAQAQYYARLPGLMKDTRPDYVTLGLMHDVNSFGPGMEALNLVGVRNPDGSPKKSWTIVTNLSFATS